MPDGYFSFLTFMRGRDVRTGVCYTPSSSALHVLCIGYFRQDADAERAARAHKYGRVYQCAG